MDARIEKTLKKIRDAYLFEKRGKDREQVKVSDVCMRAGINKTTFYNHFRDVFHLAETMENDLVDQIVSACKHADKILSDPRLLFTELLSLMTAQEETISILFDARRPEFVAKLGERFLRKYDCFLPSERDKNIASLCLMGSSFLLGKDFNKRATGSVIDLLCEIIENVR